MRKTLLLLCLGVPPLLGQPLLTFENRPLGKPDEPLVLSSYLPDPGFTGSDDFVAGLSSFDFDFSDPPSLDFLSFSAAFL